MNLTDVVMLLLFIVVFVVAPAVLIQLGSRRKHANHSNLQECPSCGAENHKAKERCYCCGYDLAARRSEGTSEALLQRVKQADEKRMKSRIKAESSQTAKH